MPYVNHCRQALVERCLNLCDNDQERAVKTLDRVVRGDRDFLVQYACIPPRRLGTTSDWSVYLKRFDAEHWVQDYLKRHSHKRGTYYTLLARAFVMTPQLNVPDDVWEVPEFTEAFEREMLTLLNLAQNQLPKINNMDLVRSHERARVYIDDIERRPPTVFERYGRLFSALISTLSVGIPPAEIAQRFLTLDEYDEYLALLAQGHLITAHLSLDDCLSAGRRRQQRNQGRWCAADTRRAMSLLSILVKGIKHGDSEVVIAEAYERFTNQETAKKNSADISLIEEASNLHAWRIRRADTKKWRDALTDEEWTLYMQCDRAMRQGLTPGVLSRVPRRHFTQRSVVDMKERNLRQLCHALHCEAAVDQTL